MTSRYRQTMAEAMNKMLLAEKEINKLRNGVKVLGNALPNRALAQKMADKANKEMGHDADVYKSPFNNRFYVRIKEEKLNEQDHEISMARGELEAISDKALKLSSILQGKSDDAQLEAWVQSKITKAKDYINSVADYMEYNPDNAMEEVKEDKDKLQKMKTINDLVAELPGVSDNDFQNIVKLTNKMNTNPSSSDKAQYKSLATKLLSKAPSNKKKEYDGYLKSVMGEEVELDEGKVECPKCEGKGCDHCNNKGYHMAESFNDAQIAKLKKEYEPLRGQRISVDNANKLGAMFTKFDKDKNALEKLYGGNIPFISTMAMTRLMTKHNYKAADLNKIRKESVELADELFMLEEVHMLDEAEATVSRFKGEKEAENIMSLAKQQGVKATKSGNQIHLKGMFRKVMDISMALQKNGMKVEEIMNEEKLEEFTSQQIKMAYGVANDKRYKAGNYSGAVAAIEKIAKGLSKHPDVMKVLKKVNEDLDEGMMSKVDQMQKDGKSAVEIAKELKLDVKTVKGILGEELDEMTKDSAYAIGMAQAKKAKGDEPPLKKSTITKGHEIAKSILKKEEKVHPGKMKYEEIAGLKKKAEKSGMPYGILKKVYDRGMAAWRGGHRPGASQQQWAFARVNSFVTKSSGTWGGADKDLAAKVKGSK